LASRSPPPDPLALNSPCMPGRLSYNNYCVSPMLWIHKVK
jgi:hypothetical protein